MDWQTWQRASPRGLEIFDGHDALADRYRKRFLPLAPDLAGEIVSLSNSPGEIERKIGIYLQAGMRVVWVIYPWQRQVVIHTPGEAPRVLTESDDIPGGDVLPGLAIPVAGIFG